MKSPFNPKDFGAETRADVGVFLVGAAIGGIADAVLNVAGFAEPLVFASLCGGGALGLKKLLVDVPGDKEKPPATD